MENVSLFRFKKSNQGTLGKLQTESGFTCYTLELPWKENKPNMSCIPTGEYITKIRLSPRFGKTYWVSNVPNRSYILIHSGNYAGDSSIGYKTNVNGCILLGTTYGTLQKQLAVLNSRIAIRRFMEIMNNNEFLLVIKESWK